MKKILLILGIIVMTIAVVYSQPQPSLREVRTVEGGTITVWVEKNGDNNGVTICFSTTSHICYDVKVEFEAENQKANWSNKNAEKTCYQLCTGSRYGNRSNDRLQYGDYSDRITRIKNIYITRS